jgi:3-deoxy-D-manno-octulosonate 8-phosphate phosphatase KdsC-like HAD superfamily phosphatase
MQIIADFPVRAAILTGKSAMICDRRQRYLRSHAILKGIFDASHFYKKTLF